MKTILKVVSDLNGKKHIMYFETEQAANSLMGFFNDVAKANKQEKPDWEVEVVDVMSMEDAYEICSSFAQMAGKPEQKDLPN